MPHPQAGTLIVSDISLEADGSVNLSYLRPDHDLKAVGVMQTHFLTVPRGGQYDDEIDALLDAVRALIFDVIEDWPNLEPDAGR